MPSNLRVDNISPSTGTNLGIGTAGGTVTLTGSVTGSLSGLSNTGITTVSAGSASAPSISPTGDSNTGIFFPSADTIAFAEGGAEALRIDSSGRLGIGTNNPSNKAHVYATSGNDGLVVENTSASNIGFLGAKNGEPTIQVGQFGSSASGTTFGLSNSNLAFIYTTTYGTTHPSALALGNYGSGPLVFATNNVERVRISSSGNTGIGTNNPSAVLDVESNDASAYIAEFRQKNANNSAQLIIDSPTNGTSRPVLIDLARAGTVQWSIGQGYLASSDRLIFATSSLKDGTAGEQIAISTTGNIILKSGAGIDFSATSNSSGTMTSELLDDYEVGTFTPSVIGSSTAGTGTYTTRSGKYIKIGGMVYVEVAMSWTSHTGSGNMFFGGFPFTSASTSNGSGVSIGRISNISLSASKYLQGFVAANDTLIALRQYPVGGGVEDSVPMDTAGDVNYSVTYMVV